MIYELEHIPAVILKIVVTENEVNCVISRKQSQIASRTLEPRSGTLKGWQPAILLREPRTELSILKDSFFGV
jgi:hypothetical protein